MAFSFSDTFKKEQERRHNLKYITIGDKQVHVSKLKDRSVTPEQYKEMRMNSYAQDDLPGKLTDAALIEKAKYFLKNCTPQRSFPCTTYDESVIHKILPELIKRLEEKQ